MSALGLKAPTPEVMADVHFRLGNACPSKWCRDYTIHIDRNPMDRTPEVAFYTSRKDAREADIQVLDFWDRPSFREVYRHARMWRMGGIGHRLLKKGGAA
tara:strand:+ start:230 stop:529 length:300 start_codon:yes stop_codon:yes gene_type:complete